jgi:hypothetical protein
MVRPETHVECEGYCAACPHRRPGTVMAAVPGSPLCAVASDCEDGVIAEARQAD